MIVSKMPKTAANDIIVSMNIYIAYKYRYIADKPTLVGELEQLSDFLAAKGHKPFILGRDIQKWEHHKGPKIKTLFDIFRHIQGKDMLLVYLNSDVHSNGIPFEVLFAKLFGLKIVLNVQKGIKIPKLKVVADTINEFENIDHLKNILDSQL